MATTETKPQPNAFWNFINGLLPTTSGPAQAVDPNVATFKGLADMEREKQQGQGQNQLANLRAIGELQAQEQARKDANNQALQNQLRGPGGSVTPWSSGYFKPEQLANPQLNAAWAQTPEWAKQSSLLTPEGMKNAVAVSQVQNPFNANPQQAQAGVSYNTNMQNGLPTGKSVYGLDGTLKGFSQGNVNPNVANPFNPFGLLGAGEFYQPSAQLSQSLQQAQSPWANWSNMIGKSNETMQNPAVLAAMRLKNPAWTPIR